MTRCKLTLVRSYLKDRTVGWILEEPSVVTLERPWLNNKTDVSCIPEGTSIVTRDTTGVHQYYRVQDVEGRTFIEWHGGVVPTHSNGCTLVGTHHDSRYNLKGSDNALAYLLAKYPDGFELEIRQFKLGDRIYE